MTKRRQTAKEMKKSAKLSGKLLIWAIPVVLVVSFLLTLASLPTWLIVLINIVVGGAVCFVVYIIYDKIEEKKKQKEKTEPKKYDPFSD